MTKIIQQARRFDIDRIKHLLKNADLPIEDITEEMLQNFLILIIGGEIKGCVGLEIKDEFGLLRSLVINSEYKGQGLGKILLEEIENWARSNNLTALYLLTDTSPQFFEKHEYVNIQRNAAPTPIKETMQFSHICGDNALTYVKKL